MDLEINKVLSQMRALQANMGDGASVVQPTATQSFGQAMNDADQKATHAEINKVLSQMRALQASMGMGVSQGAAVEQTGAVEAFGKVEGFGEVVFDAIEDVNKQQSHAVSLAEQFQAGSTDTSAAAVMVELQKASVSFQAMTEVRNRLIEAYREVMNMPV